MGDAGVTLATAKQRPHSPPAICAAAVRSGSAAQACGPALQFLDYLVCVAGPLLGAALPRPALHAVLREENATQTVAPIGPVLVTRYWNAGDKYTLDTWLTIERCTSV